MDDGSTILFDVPTEPHEKVEFASLAARVLVQLLPALGEDDPPRDAFAVARGCVLALAGTGDAAAHVAPDLLAAVSSTTGTARHFASQGATAILFDPGTQPAFARWLRAAPRDAMHSVFSGLVELECVTPELEASLCECHARSDAELRAVILYALSLKAGNTPRLFALARDALDDPDFEIRAAAVTALGHTDPLAPEVARRLSALAHDEHATVRLAVAHVSSHPELTDAGLLLLDDGDPTTRWAAARELANHPQHGRRADEVLVVLAEDKARKPALRLDAASALGEHTLRVAVLERLAFEGIVGACLDLAYPATGAAMAALARIASTAPDEPVRAEAALRLAHRRSFDA